MNDSQCYLVKGQESKLCEALGGIVGLFYNFTIIKMKGPNKTIELKKKLKLNFIGKI